MQTWDPTKFIITVGPHTVTGFAPDTFITAERNNDAYTLEIGADGLPTRIRNADRSGRFTIVLQKSSPTNTYLAAVAAVDEASGQGILPVQVKNNGNLAGLAVASGQNCWIVKHAPLEGSKEMGTETWILETGVLNINAAGIDDITPELPTIAT